MTSYAVVVRGAAAPAGAISPDVLSVHPDVEPEPETRACTETTKAGEPCKGTPGDDGLCAAHKKAGTEE